MDLLAPLVTQLWARARDRARVLLAFVCVCWGCASPPPAPLSAPEPVALSPAQLEELLAGDYEQLSGSWDSEYGTVQLMFDDATSFRALYPDGSLRGRIDVEREALEFEWEDDFSNGRGVFEIIDLDTLRGSWGVGESSSNGGRWQLSR